jgi:RNA polymerase primary sigma factor
MTDEELVSLIKAGIDIKDNMEKLYIKCYGYIRWVAKRYIDYADIEDLMQEGYIALNNAVYDYNANLSKFTTFLYTYLMRQYEKTVLKNDSHGGFNKHYNSRVIGYLKLRRHFKCVYGREPTIEENVAYLRLPMEAIKRIEHMVSVRNTVSINCIVGEDDEELTIEGTLQSSDNTEQEVIDRLMEDNLKVGLWEIVKDAVNEDEYSAVCAVYKFNMPLEKYSVESDTTRRVATNNFYSGLGKLRSPKVRNRIADKLDIDNAKAFKTGLNRFKSTFTSATEDVAIKNIETELNYISYVLTAAYEGITLLSKSQIKLAIENRLIDEDLQLLTEWKIPKRGIAGEEIEQFDKKGKLIKRWSSAHDASESTGISVNDIRRCANGARATTGGFIWKRVEQE